jgi:hypothetical protein
MFPSVSLVNAAEQARGSGRRRRAPSGRWCTKRWKNVWEAREDAVADEHALGRLAPRTT